MGWQEELNALGRAGTPCLFVLDYALKYPWIKTLSDLSPDEVLFDLGKGIRNHEMDEMPREFHFIRHPVSMSEYQEAFDRVHEEFLKGNTFLLNLSFPTRVECDLSLRQIFGLSRARYRLWFKNRFVVFSPESFIRIEDGVISSFPMKGTIDASVRDAEQKILSNEKELAEHTAIVDLIRNDLSRIAANVRVQRFRYVEEVQALEKNLLQVSSEIRGDLGRGWQSRLGDILASLLPAGSISGAPKVKTCEIIDTVESYDRGYFTGVFGVFDGERVESAVMIRFLEHEEGAYVFKSGGGLMVYSDPGEEYQEMVDKVYVPIPGKH